MTESRRFTYGAQFTPVKVDLVRLLALADIANQNREKLQNSILSEFFADHGRNPAQRQENSRKMAMNCLLSMKSYGLVSFADKGKSYRMTSLARKLLELRESPVALYRYFAIHILTNLDGLMLCRVVDNIRSRGERTTLETLGEDLNELGIRIPTNSTYISTMKSWLVKAGAMRSSGYQVNWDVVHDLLGVNRDLIDDLFALPTEQKHFLMSLISLGAVEFMPSNKVARHTRNIYRVRLTTKNLVKDIIEPLESAGLVETRKRTTGRGAKPHDVRLTQKACAEILAPLIENLADVSEMSTAELNRSFEDVIQDLKSENNHVKGKALELLAVWIIRLLSLKFIAWRLRSYQATGGSEVDLMAASDKIVYNRWQIQCKNQNSVVDLKVIAREVGITFLTRADVVMIITTSKFTQEAIDYANLVSDRSRYYVILLEKDDIARIANDRTQIVDILNRKAERAFARREFALSNLDDDSFFGPVER